MGVQEMALMLLGIGLISERFGGGRGLQEFGTGVQKLFAAPLTGTGTGLASFAGGIKTLAESFGDIGRGISALLGGIPAWALPGYVGPGGSGSGQLPKPGALLPAPVNGNGPIAFTQPYLVQDSGGSDTQLLTGGGGNVPGAGGRSFSLVDPSAFVRARYSVTPGVFTERGLGLSGWWVSNSPIQDAPAGGGSLI